MAQLSDDCFAFGGALLGVDAALALIEERIAPLVAEESVPLAMAAGRILARDLVAQFDVPPHANSAVDGFALAHADLSPDRETVLPVAGRAAAGHPLGRAAARGEAIRIFTGAPMPDGTTTVGPSARQSSCMNTVSAPCGIGAPVKMRIASPVASGRAGACPATTRSTTASLVSAAGSRSAWRTA